MRPKKEYYVGTLVRFKIREREYLDTAKKVADYCLKNISESGIIPVDFRQPPELAWEDSCSACVIAGELLELAKCLEPEEGGVSSRQALAF